MDDVTADYQFQLIANVVVIFGVDSANALQGDMNDVLHDIDRQVDGGIGHRAVIYRDAAKTFAGVDHRGDRFAGFYALNETVLEPAIAKALSITRAITSRRVR